MYQTQQTKATFLHMLEASARSLSWTLIFYALFLTIVAGDVSTF